MLFKIRKSTVVIPAKAGIYFVGMIFSAFCFFLVSCTPDSVSHPAKVMDLGLGLQQTSAGGGIFVEKDDNLGRIASRYRLPLRDIIDLNALEPPYKIKAGQRLRLPAPTDYRVGEGDTIFTVARHFNVDLSKLVRVNNLQHPYGLEAGKTLRIPLKKMSAAKTAAQKKKEPQKDLVILKETKNPTFIWPAKGKVISTYGPKGRDLFNEGVNIAVPHGTPVKAAAAGTIVYTGDDLKSYGNLILIRHSGGITTAYAHLEKVSVQKGARVQKGQVIGTAGATGSVETSQLHFEIRKGRETKDPLSFL